MQVATSQNFIMIAYLFNSILPFSNNGSVKFFCNVKIFFFLKRDTHTKEYKVSMAPEIDTRTPDQMKRKFSIDEIPDSVKKLKTSNTEVMQQTPDSMKRKLFSTDMEDQVKKMKTSDLEVLKEMQNKLNQTDTNINAEVEITKQKYFVSYFKKVLKELPVCNNIIDLDSIQENRDGFFKTYSIAKTCVNSHLQLKKIMAFNSIFDMVHGVIGKFVHDKYVKPSLKNFLSESSLSNAFVKYQESLISEDREKIVELHCIAYLIQSELEKQEVLRIPNPLYNRFTQQMSAISKYITEIIKEIAMKPLNISSEIK